MITFYLLVLIPIIFACVAKFMLRKTISWLEMFSMIFVSSLLMGGVYFAGLYCETSDVEAINGLVTDKSIVRVHCTHSYSCNCSQTCSSGKTRSCSTHCDTCYDHSFDQNWYVHSTIGTFTINTIDRQGLREPQRWTTVKQHDPVSRAQTYVNYVKAVPESLFNFNIALIHNYTNSIPLYPLDVYDYYRVNRFIADGVQVSDAPVWNDSISRMVGALGPTKEVNAIVVVTKQSDSLYARAIQASWLGGKKNDVVVIIGAPNYPNIAWVDVFSWSTNSLFDVKLRDDILSIGSVQRESVIAAMTNNITAAYHRKSMKEFEYLKDQIEPPTWVIITAIILSVLSLAVLGYYFNKIDLYKELRKCI